MATIPDLNDLSFDEFISQAEKPVLVDFWAAWCGPCRSLAPTMEAIAEEEANRLMVARVNVDECRELSARFRISSIPALILFKGGEPVAGVVGAMPKEQILNQFNQYI